MENRESGKRRKKGDGVVVKKIGREIIRDE